MSEARYWLRLLAACTLGGLFVFYGVLNVMVKGGKVEMPEIKGLSRAAAEHKLHGQGLSLVVKEERFSTHPSGTVLEQRTEAGTTLKRGREVEVVLSKGTKIVSVPQLAGLASSRQARLLLDQNGLVPGVMDAIFDEAPKDSVLAQWPDPGAEAARGDAVSLLVSLGPRKLTYVMPDLAGGDLGLARGLARRMGLILRKVIEKKSAALTPGAVLTQSLAAGSRVEEGAELFLTAVEGQAGSEGARLAEVAFEVPEEGYIERRVRITVTDALGERHIHNAMAKPGSMIKVETRVHGKASYKVNLGGVDMEENEIP